MKTNLTTNVISKDQVRNRDLDKLENVDLFPAKTAIAKSIIANSKLPGRKPESIKFSDTK